MNACESAGKDLEGDLCNVGPFKAASAGGFCMSPNGIRVTRMTFSSLECGSGISFTRGKLFIVLREQGSDYLAEGRCQMYRISLKNF